MKANKTQLVPSPVEPKTSAAFVIETRAAGNQR